MFRRRKQQPVHHRVGNLIWPQIGFRRSVTYIWHRLARLHGTPHSIAGGFAAGAAISFTPFVGIHLLLAALISWLTRGNIMAGLLGTAVGNPWTFPFIWVWVYELGRRMGAGHAEWSEPDALAIIVDLPGVVARALFSFDLDWAYFDNLWSILWPMMLGSIPSFALVWLATYLLLKPIVATYQARRIMRRRRKRERARELAKQSIPDAAAAEEYDPVEILPDANSQVAKEANR